MKLAMLLMGCSIIGMASVAATQQTAYVPPGTTVVTDPTTGSATYDDGVMSGTLTGFHIVIMQDFIDNDQTAPVLITPTPLGSTLTNLTFTVTPPESGTVDTAIVHHQAGHIELEIDEACEVQLVEKLGRQNLHAHRNVLHVFFDFSRRDDDLVELSNVGRRIERCL